ncbi:MAG: cyclase family protein [Deinococcales bacterium]
MIDITRRISNASPNWPGDVPVHYTLSAEIAKGAAVNVGKLTMSTHTGTHVDAPWHYDASGVRLHEIPLETWVGPCLVVDVCGATKLEPSVLVGQDLRDVTKVLFYTGQPNTWHTFPLEWACIDPALPPYLAALGIDLIGTDAPSADSLNSKDLPGHAALARSGVCILESLALEGVVAGRYRLICLPLNLEDADGAPARCILERF